MILRRLAPALLLLVATGCAANEPALPSPDAAAAALAAGLADGELGSVGWTAGAEPGDELASVVDGMDGVTRTVTAKAGTPVAATEKTPAKAPVTLSWSWDLSGHTWSYDTTTELTLVGNEWQAQWQRTLVEPTLNEGAVLDRQTIRAVRGAITGAGGVPLITLRPVVRFGIDRTMVPAARAGRSAKELARALGTQPGPYAKTVKAAGAQAFVEAIVLRRDDVPATLHDVTDIPGARAIPGDAQLGPTADFALPLLGRVGPVTAEMVAKDPDRYQVGDVAGLSGLEARYDAELTGTDGVTVDVISTDGEHREVFRVDAMDGEPLATTLDENLQFEAEHALATITPAAALVAIRPSDGAVLAAANGPGTNGVNIATYGQTAPGSTMKIIDALALLRAGLDPGSTVQCPATLTVDGKRFGNYSGYPSAATGAIPLRAALGHSCNTAFIGSRTRLGADPLDALAAAGASLGFGVDHDLGAPAFFGEIPGDGNATGVAAAMIGQGEVLASPFAIATVMASVVAGRTVVPQIVTSVPVEVPDGVAQLTAQEVKQLRSMLRYVVTDGSGSGLLDIPGKPVLAKTGTAEFVRDGKVLTHAWMVAGQGDLAVAVYVDEGESGSGTAGPILERFLRAAGSR